jgi:hypothetical protein
MIATWCEPQHEHDQRTAESKRYLQTRDQGDGTTRGSFVLPTESLESYFTVLETLARATGLDDQRSAGERRADALVEVFDLAARFGELPESSGLRTQVHYVVPAGWAAGGPPPPFADLVGASLPGGRAAPPEAACATGAWTGPATRARIEALLCDARISRVLLQPRGQVQGRESVRGEISRAQRRALVARDRGCVHRGCTRPPAFCDAHHLTAREDGGQTTLDNLVNCEYAPCHRARTRQGWSLRPAHRYLAAVAHADDLYEQDCVVHLVHDAVRTHPDPVRTGFARQRYAARGAWRLAEQIDGRSHPLPFFARQRVDGLDRPSGDLHQVTVGRFSHASPRSALTCSQGT